MQNEHIKSLFSSFVCVQTFPADFVATTSTLHVLHTPSFPPLRATMFRLLPLAALLLLLPGTAAATADKVRMYEKVRFGLSVGTRVVVARRER